MNRFISVALFAFAIGAMLHPAYAADVCPAGTICFAGTSSWLKDLLETLLLGVTTVLVGYGAAFLRSKWGLNVSKDTEAQVNKAVSDAAGLVLGRVENLSAFEIKVGNPLIADGANWALTQIPGALTKMGITPEKERAWLEEHIAAILGHMTADAPDTAAANPTRL